MFLGFTSQCFHKKSVKSIVFSWLATRQKFYFFSENSWLFFKSEQLRQIFVTSFYLLFVLSSQIETIKLFKGRHSVCYLRYMAFFSTLTWDILRISVFLKVKSLWYIGILEKIIKLESSVTSAQKSLSHNLPL